MDALSNKEKGDAFEQVAKDVLETYLGVTLERPEPIDGHRFDWASPDGLVVVECKCLGWTASGNVPSAKIDNLNEAVNWLTKVPSAIRKILCMSRSVHSSKKESLAEYFVRTSKSLPKSGISVFEINETGTIRKIV